MSLIVDDNGVMGITAKGIKAKPNRGFGAGPGHEIFGMMGQQVNPSVAKKFYSQMDKDQDAKITLEELTEWLVRKRMFPTLNSGDTKLTSARLFNDIDTDRNGSLCFPEFYQFLQLVQREQRLLTYANKHHLTCLPPSVRVTNTREFSLPMLENILHEKIQQLTSRDSDRYRQILTLFKQQVQRSAGKADDITLQMTARDFNTFLSMLGLFATREQADLLFQKYDVNGDGVLTVHEFLTKAKAPDYPGLNLDSKHFDFRRGRGKKMFTDTSRYGIPVKVTTPNPNIYDMGTENICTRIRERLEQTAKTGTAFSDQKARRKLFKAFEQKDPNRTGLISVKDFKDMLELSVGVVMGGPHIRALCSKYADENAMIDYPRMVIEVYPPTEAPSSSLYRSPSLSVEKEKQSARRKWNTKARNQVHLTGSYWATPTQREMAQSTRSSRQGSAGPLPPLSAGSATMSSRGMMGIPSVRSRSVTPKV